MDLSVDGSRSSLKLLRKSAGYGLLLIPLLFLGVFYLYPLGSILGLSFMPEGQLDLSGFSRIIESSYYRNTFGFTLWQALLSTGLTLVLALPGAYVFARYRFPGRSLLLSLSSLTFVLPTIVVAVAFMALIGPRGVLNTALMDLFQLDAPPIQLERTLTIIIIVHVFYNYSVALRIISSAWINLSPQMEEAARVLGARGWQLWWHIRLPLLRPSILAATVLIFIFTFTSFGVILVLGGPRFATLEVEIYRQAANLFNLPMAAALSLVQIGFMLVMMLVYTRLQQQSATDIRPNSARKPRNWREAVFVWGNIGLMVTLLFSPLLALLVRSVTTPDGVSLNYYRLLGENVRGGILFVPPLQAVGNSLFFATLTMLLAVALGLITAYLLGGGVRHRLVRWLDPLFMLPLATSAVTLGFGYIIALDRPPLNLRSSWVLIPIAHTLVAMPFVVRSVLPSLRSISPSLRESATVLGASRWRVWRWIDLPLIWRGLVVGATFAFTSSMGEFGASLFIARPDTPTMPVVIFRLLGQPGQTNYGQALAMSMILMFVCGVSFVLIERFRSPGVGEF
jgi:thiamine transport system permease protein